MKKTPYLSSLVVAVLLIASLQARAIPGRWEKVENLRSGSRIIVSWMSGDKLEYLYRDSRDAQLLVTDLAGNQLEIPKLQVKKIQRGIPSNDSLVDGTLTGLGIGFAVFALLAIGCFNDDLDSGKCFAGFTLTGAAIGAAAGLAADAGVKGHEVLYKAPR